MHLKILIGVLTLGLASANPKAKPAAKASPQDYSAGQPIYFSVGANNFEQSYAGQPFPGQYPAGPYDVRLASNYGYSSGNPFGLPLYPQSLAGNYYQQPQPIPVPLTYSNPSENVVQSANYNGAARLWPKNLVSPTGSPSPALVSSPPIYYPSSTPSPIAYQSATGNYANPSVVRNLQSPVPTPPYVQAQYPQPIPVPVKVGSRNSFPSQINYNTAPYNGLVPASTPAPYLASYQQQSTPTPVQSYQQSAAAPYGAYQQQVSSSPYAPQYQQPSAGRYQVNYQQQPTPAPYQVNYQQQPTPAPYQVNYQQQPTPAPYQVNYQQQSTPAPYQVNYQQQSTPSPYQVNYQQQSTPSPYQVGYQQQSTPSPYQVGYQQYSNPASYGASYQRYSVSPYAVYQQGSTVSPYLQYQRPTAASAYGANYQNPTASPFLASYQRIPVPVAYPQNQILPQPTKPSLTSLSTASSYPSTKFESVAIQPNPVNSPAPQTVSITEKPFYPVPTTPSSTSKPLATIIKSEYTAGTVSPQYNHIPSQSTVSPLSNPTNAYLPQATGSPSIGRSQASESSSQGFSGYSPSTAVSNVSYNGLGASYNY